MLNYVYFSCIFILDMDRCKIILFLYTIVAEVADLVLDWDFFVEIEKTDAVQDWIKVGVFIFAIIGSIFFIMVFLEKICSFCCEDDDEEEDDRLAVGLSLSSTIIEDLPQLFFAIAVALTVEELLSPVQIGKAVYAIVEPCVKIVLNGFEIHKMKNDKRKRKIRHRRCKIIEIVICCFTIICSSFLLINLIIPIEDKIHDFM